MIHLKIELNNGITEQVSSSVIKKLYEIVHSGNLDSSSNLMGSLNATSTYLKYVDYLEELFTKNGVRLLVITANKLYISFADPVVDSYWANSTYGDGVGITAVLALGVTNVPSNAFKNNTTITSFNELNLFGITSLYYLCFDGCSNLTSIDTRNILTFGDGCLRNTGITSLNLSSCTSIGESSMQDCSNLLTIIQGTVPFTLSKSVFYRCSSLLAIDLRYLSSAIKQSCFSGCTNLSSVTLTGNTTTNQIDAYAFYGCSSLASIDLSNITYIASGAFTNCSSLTTIDLSSCTTMNGEAFANCIGLTTVSNTSNITTIEQRAFYLCTSLASFGSLTSCTAIGNLAFQGCSSLDITDWDLSSVTFLGNYAFTDCSNLKGTLDLSGVTSLALYLLLFSLCSRLSQIKLGSINTIGTSYTNVNKSMFYKCTNLKIVDIVSVGTIALASGGGQVFYDCPNFKALVLRCTTVPAVTYNNNPDTISIELLNGANSTMKIYVPDAALTDYESAWGSYLPSNTILPLTQYNELTILAS